MFLLFFLLLLFFAILNFTNDNNQHRIKNLRLITVLSLGGYLFLIAAIRHPSVGIDVENYILFFNKAKSQSVQEVLLSNNEFGYYLMNKFILLFTDNPQILLAIIAGIFCFSVSNFIYRYSKNICLSFLVFFTVNFYYFSLCTLRQTIAMAILLFSTPYIMKKNFVRFALIVALAATFHTSSLIFFLAYIFGNKNITKMYLFFSGIGLIFILICSQPIVAFFIKLYPAYGLRSSGSSIATWILFIFITSLMVFFRNDILSASPRNKFYFNLAVLSLFFQSMSLTLDVIFRIAMYFSIYFITAIPEMLHALKNKRLATLGYICFTSLLLLIYFGFTYDNAGVFPYKFYWQ